MYKIVDGFLIREDIVNTPKQTAVIRSTITQVLGYDGPPIELDTIPGRENRPDAEESLHWIDGALVWVYTPYPDRVADLEAENAALALELAITQARVDDVEAEQAALILSLVDGGVL